MSRTAREYVNIEVTYVAENGSSKTCYNTAAEADCEFGSRTERSPCFFRHGAESQFMTKLVYSELSNSIGYLSSMMIALVSSIPNRKPCFSLAKYR